MSQMIKDKLITDEEIVYMRDKFVTEVCKDRNWDRYNLTFEQICEIREMKGWKAPGLITG